MKFMIDSTKYQRTGETTASGTLPLKSLANDRPLFLDGKAADILDHCDVWEDFDELLRGQKSRRKELYDALVLLNCFGVAQIEEETCDPALPRTRIAGEREYRSVSAFLLIHRHLKDAYFLHSDVPDEYYSEDNLRARQFNNQEYNFYIEQNGLPRALLQIAMPDPTCLTRTATICGLVCDAEADEEEKHRFPAMLLDRACSALRKDCGRLRFLCTAETQSFRTFLTEQGFREIGRLTAELPDGGDVTILDLQIDPKAEEEVSA